MSRGKIERRGSKPRRTKPVILIVTEGEKSEPKYFQHFRTRQNNVEVRVVPNSKNGCKTDYLNLIRKASRICKEDDLTPKSGDSVWIITDGDVNYQAKDAVKKKNEAYKRPIHCLYPIPALNSGICSIYATQQRICKTTAQ